MAQNLNCRDTAVTGNTDLNATLTWAQLDSNWNQLATSAGVQFNNLGIGTTNNGVSGQAVFSGYIGIGTSAPTYSVEAVNASNGKFAKFSYTGGTKSPYIQLSADSDTVVRLTADNSDNTAALAFSVSGTERAKIDSAGVVTIANTTDATTKDTGCLVVEGGIGVEKAIFAGGNITAYSDGRVKTNLEIIQNAIAKISALTGYIYLRTDSNEKQTGLIAQDVLKVLPEAVVGTEEIGYGIAYGNLTGLLVQAIKEQQVMIKEQNDRINKLELLLNNA